MQEETATGSYGKGELGLLGLLMELACRGPFPASERLIRREAGGGILGEEFVFLLPLSLLPPSSKSLAIIPHHHIPPPVQGDLFFASIQATYCIIVKQYHFCVSHPTSGSEATGRKIEIVVTPIVLRLT